MVKPINETDPAKRERIAALRTMFDALIRELMVWGSEEIPQRLYKAFTVYLNNRDIKGVHIAGEGMRNNICTYRLSFNVEEYSII